MKAVAVIILLIYQVGLMLINFNTKEEYLIDLKDKLSLLMGIIPIAMCIILAM